MANALLYFRDPTHRTVDVASPTNLPSGNKLSFTFPDNILEGITESYKNNVKQIPLPNQDGVRKLNLQENGLVDNRFTINGVFEKSVGAGIAQLKSMRKRIQVDTYHKYGIFGIKIDNAPSFNIDPNDTIGLFIDSTSIGYVGQKSTRYDFSVTLGFGGTI